MRTIRAHKGAVYDMALQPLFDGVGSGMMVGSGATNEEMTSNNNVTMTTNNGASNNECNTFNNNNSNNTALHLLSQTITDTWPFPEVE